MNTARAGQYGERVLLTPARSWLFDGGLVAVLLVLVVAEIFVPFSSVLGEGSSAQSTVAGALVCLALVMRRRWPLASLAFVMVVSLTAFHVADVYVLFWGQLVPMTIAMYSVARHDSARNSVIGATLGSAILVAFDLSVTELRDVGEIFFHWLVLAVAWIAGRVLHTKEANARDSRTYADRVLQESGQNARAAVVEERARIARELHDVVAHAVSMMVVQAGAAGPAVDDDPAFAKAALETIRTTGAGAMAEMRRMVTMLRVDDSLDSLGPQPGLDALPHLVTSARDAGLDVRVAVHGDSRTLPAGLDLAAYRIVQEALTNVRRHASADRAEIRIRYERDRVELAVTDNGSTTPGTCEPGHGIIGMQERASLYGGTFHAGHTGSGFRVAVALPMEQL